MLKNILLFVKDINRSLEFYQDVFGLSVKAAYEGNVVLIGGLVLQDIFCAQVPCAQKTSGGCAQGRAEDAAFGVRPWHASGSPWGGLPLDWEAQTGLPVNPGLSNTMLYFEEPSIEEIRCKLQSRGIETVLSEDTNPDGKRFIRFCDPDGHLIEVAEKY